MKSFYKELCPFPLKLNRNLFTKRSILSEKITARKKVDRSKLTGRQVFEKNSRYAKKQQDRSTGPFWAVDRFLAVDRRTSVHSSVHSLYHSALFPGRSLDRLCFFCDFSILQIYRFQPQLISISKLFCAFVLYFEDRF